MAMGTRKKRERQEDLWVVSSEIVGTPAHAFYDRLNEILDRHHFDRNVEHLCRRYYKGPLGRPSIAPGVYFRALLLGYFEGIDSERGIAWRLADSLSMRWFIAYALTEATPDHSSISRTRRLFAVETHTAVFRWVLKILAEEGLVEGKTVSIDATTLEANAALRSLVRRDNGQKYDEYLKDLSQAAGIENPRFCGWRDAARSRFRPGRRSKPSGAERFFYCRPSFVHPELHFLRVAFASLHGRPRRSPVHRSQDLPHMTGMVVDTGHALHHERHPRQRPQIRVEAVGPRPLP
jgi:transposase